MGRLRCRRGEGENFLIYFLLRGLHCHDGLRHLVLLTSELILIGTELLYAAPGKRKVNRHGFKLLLYFCRGDRGGWRRP